MARPNIHTYMYIVKKGANLPKANPSFDTECKKYPKCGNLEKLRSQTYLNILNKKDFFQFKLILT